MMKRDSVHVLTLVRCYILAVITSGLADTTERTANSSVSHCPDAPLTLNHHQTSVLQVYPPSVESSPEETETIIPLYIGLMTGEESAVVPAVQIALDAINDHPNLLDGYSLHYTLTQSTVNSWSCSLHVRTY